jgi:putative pyruvate formate lyase activating enzyme
MNSTAHQDIMRRRSEAQELLRACAICPRHCGVNRIEGETGYCRTNGAAHCFREMMGFNEEQELTPSHQVYFAGCNLRCSFCTVAEWNAHPADSGAVDKMKLVQMIGERRRNGCRILNILGGEPAVSIEGILELLATLNSDTCVVWNSNMYYSKALHSLLDGLVDVYLADYKCGNDQCAKELLDAGDYLDVIQRNMKEAQSTADLIVRHLILPNHWECCTKPILDWLATEMPNVKVSLRGNYVPPTEVETAPDGYLEDDTYKTICHYAEGLGLNLVQ